MNLNTANKRESFSLYEKGFDIKKFIYSDVSLCGRMYRVVKNKDIVTQASTKQPPSKATHMDIMTIENKFIEDAISICAV